MAEERGRASSVLQRREAASPMMCPATTGAGSVQWWCSIGSPWTSKPSCLPWVNLASAHTTSGVQNAGHLLAQKAEMAGISDRKHWVRNGPRCLCREALSCWPRATTFSMTKLNQYLGSLQLVLCSAKGLPYSSTVKPHQFRRAQVGSLTSCMDCELLQSSWAGSKTDLQKAEEEMTVSVRPLIFRISRLRQSGSSIERLR